MSANFDDFLDSGVEQNADAPAQDTVREETGSIFEQLDDSDTSDKELLDQARDSIKEDKEEPASNDSEDKVTEDDIKEEIKLIKALHGEKEFELPEDALLTHTVDGEEVQISLQDLKNHYSGQVAWDKRFSELDAERRDFIEDKNMVESYINEFSSFVQKGDEIGAMEFLAEISGADPLQIRRNMREQFMREALQRQGLSEAEIQLLDTKEELDFANKRRESEEQRLTASQAEQEARGNIDGIQETFNLSDAELVALYDNVVQNHGAGLSDGQIVNLMQEQANTDLASSGAEYLLGEVNSDLITEDNIEAVSELILDNPEFTEEDFMEVLQEVYAVKPQSKSKKVKKAIEKKKTSQSPEKQQLNNFISFDELE